MPGRRPAPALPICDTLAKATLQTVFFHLMGCGHLSVFLRAVFFSCNTMGGTDNMGDRTVFMEAARMPKFVIEREIPGAGSLSADQLQAVSQKSCSVLRNLGPEIQWLQSYVTADKIYCVYIAPNEELVREHASQGGFPANSVARVMKVIDPTTAEA
jgi:hypothetical protein